MANPDPSPQTFETIEPDLNCAERAVWVVLVQVVDIAGQGNTEEVVLLPQTTQLLVHDICTHVEGGQGRAGPHVPQLHRLVP